MRGARACAWLVAVLLGAVGHSRAHASGRLIEEVGVSEQGSDLAVTVLFGCSLRYVSHTPASGGDSLRVRLVPQADCGSAAGGWSVPPALDDRGVIRAIDVAHGLGNDVELRIRWSRPEEFAVVPSFDGRGLRIRLIRPEVDRSSVTVREVTGPTSVYAVNLEASRQPFSPAAIAAASSVTGVRTYVSESVVDDERWYRLRAGPFATEADARRVLASSKAKYPKAWLAIGDDASLTTAGLTDAVSNVPATRAQASATLTAPDRERTLQQARSAFRRKDYPTAIPLLTKLVEQPEFPGRAEALELLGLARERSGQLAHAKAECEAYLQQYPDGAAADRVRKRLRALAFANSPAATRNGGVNTDQPAWSFVGGWSQVYRRDDAGFDTGTVSGQQTTQNALLTDAAITARRHGERFDFVGRASGGYGLDLMQDGPGDQVRIATMFAELRDKSLDVILRGGRQSGGLGGLLGTFDGLYAGWAINPKLRINAHAGYGVESTRDAPNTNRRLYALSADLGTFGGAWDVSAYAVAQDYYGVTDRQAIGTELRYFRPGLNVIGLVDYDIHYGDLNNFLLLGTVALPARWSASINVDHRRSPTLATRNALIGQPVLRFEELFGLYTPAEIEQLARDRSAASDAYTLSLSRPFGDRWQWTLDVSSMTLGATPESGGVAATEDTGTDLVLATQALGYGLFGGGDVSSFGLLFQDGQTTSAYSMGVNAQFPVGQSWRIGPRLRVDRREFHLDGSQQLLYAPGLRTELRARRVLLEFEGGAEFGSRTLDSASEDTTRYYLSLGYRYDF